MSKTVYKVVYCSGQSRLLVFHCIRSRASSEVLRTAKCNMAEVGQIAGALCPSITSQSKLTQVIETTITMFLSYGGLVICNHFTLD